MSYEHLFQPITLNTITLKNRIISTAHAEVYADNGAPNERYIRYYEEKAKGGLGLAICGGSSPVSRDSPAIWWKSIDLCRDTVIEPLHQLAEAMHKHGAKIMIQATHMGRRNAYPGGDWPYLLTSSGIREPVHRGVAKAIELHEIKRIIADFARAAKRVQASGLDGIEISAAHQHLIDQFWSKRTNLRTDEYGGSLKNRMRFGFEVLEAIREQVGADFCMGIRICGDEFHENGLSHEDLKEIAQILSDSKMVDFISVIGSGADTHNTLANCMPPMQLPPEPFVHLAAGIKSVVSIPVMHAQGVRDPNQAERLLREGMVDIVGMTRAQIADPHFVNKVREGKEMQIKQCVGANYCIDRQYLGQDVLCVQNAATSREETMPHIISKGDKKRKTVVVGAGPAGLEAARVATLRGNDVVLFEKHDKVGGQVNIAALAPQRDQMGGIIRWFDLELQRLGVDVRTNTAADVALILAENPDIVVLATGGEPNLQEWGFDDGLCVSAWDILRGDVALKKNVLVYDVFGQWTGAGCADFAARKQSLVEFVTPDPKVNDDVGGTTFPIMYRSLYAHNVIMTPNFWLTKVYQEDGKLVAQLQNEYTEAVEEREVDQVIMENGTRPDETLYFALKPQSINNGEIDIDALYDAQPQPALAAAATDGFLLYRIGEANCPRNIHGAIYDALRLCKDF